MSQLPPETMRALDARSDAWDHAEAMRTMTMQLFEYAVTAGKDIELLWPYSRGERKTYPVSTYLGESNSDAQALLFKACAEAMAGRDSGPALRSFVERVAADYADACLENWGTE